MFEAVLAVADLADVSVSAFDLTAPARRATHERSAFMRPSHTGFLHDAGREGECTTHPPAP